MKKLKLFWVGGIIILSMVLFNRCSNEEKLTEAPSLNKEKSSTSIKNSNGKVETINSEIPKKKFDAENSKQVNTSLNDSLLVTDPDYELLLKTRDDFTKRLAQSSLTEIEIINKFNNQEYTAIMQAAGYSQAEMIMTSNLIKQTSKKLIERYHLDTSNINNNRDPQQIATVIMNIRVYGDDITGKAQCQRYAYAACMVLTAEASVACTVGAGACFALGSYLCYCSYCTGAVANAICD
ncbi:MAG: hypothetical protein V4548_05180 [Bacteroidota bacterium]